MVGPELTNYIAQARAEGLSNETIRQNLISKGWNRADVDQALGLAAGPVVTTTAAMSGGHKALIIIAVIVVGLLAVGGFLLASVSRYLRKDGAQSFIQDMMRRAEESKKSDGDRAVSDSNNNTAKCSANPLASDLPANWPSDLPRYPGSILEMYLGLEGAGGATYCTQDSAAKVAAYIEANGGAWKLSSRPPGYPENAPPIPQGPDSFFFTGSKGGLNLLITIENKNGVTTIQEVVGK